ncbi:MAG: hypothetical protein HQM09_02505 [Candidatus Riflebacteria bacterium]|nr:hypothetical protein [Candidatus Riflebacteria bacterium]
MFDKYKSGMLTAFTAWTLLSAITSFASPFDEGITTIIATTSSTAVTAISTDAAQINTGSQAGVTETATEATSITDYIAMASEKRPDEANLQILLDGLRLASSAQDLLALAKAGNTTVIHDKILTAGAYKTVKNVKDLKLVLNDFGDRVDGIFKLSIMYQCLEQAKTSSDADYNELSRYTKQYIDDITVRGSKGESF